MKHCTTCKKPINDRAGDECLGCENPGMGISNLGYGASLQRRGSGFTERLDVLDRKLERQRARIAKESG